MRKGEDLPSKSRIVRYVTVAVITISTAGCSGSAPASDDPYREDFEGALEQATSDFERAVLSDLEITRAEYEEAVNRYMECASDRGVQLSSVSQGGYYVFQHSAEDMSSAQNIDGVVQQCRTGTIDLIEPLYVSTLTNPDKEDRDKLVVACLIDNRLAPSSYTVDEFKKDRTSTEDRPPEFPFDERDPRFGECMANPSRR